MRVFRLRWKFVVKMALMTSSFLLFAHSIWKKVHLVNKSVNGDEGVLVDNPPILHKRVTEGNVVAKKKKHDDGIGKQKCVVPEFDAFHPQILPYVKFHHGEKAEELKRLGRVVNGSLYFKLKDVEEAGIYYLRRLGDYQVTRSEWMHLIQDAKGEQGCLTSVDHKCRLRFELTNSILAAVCKRNGNECRTGDELYMKHGRIVHAQTEMCLIPDRCHEANFDYEGNDLRDVGGVASWEMCQLHCKKEPQCNAWLHNKHDQVCWLKTSDAKRVPSEGASTGVKHCLGTLPQRLILVDKHRCRNDLSLFEVLEVFVMPTKIEFPRRRRRLRHFESQKCIGVDPETGFIGLWNCDDSATHFVMPENFKFRRDVDLVYPLQEEFIEFKFVQNGVSHVEYHSHVIEQNLKHAPHAKRTGDELNIVIILIDSQSLKNVQRQMKKTYQYLKDDPNTIIMQSHVIVGDGTTANMTPLLSGHFMSDLPEARFWFRNSVELDEWPLIFNELRQNGYVSMYSDDYPLIGGFQHRVKGFKVQPTDKYLLPFFHVSWDTKNFGHQHAYKYLKSFQKTYHKSYKTFALLCLNLGHDDMNNMYFADDGTLDVLRYINNPLHSNNTAVIVLGDHGSRFSSYRKTIWGKYEERLPFMSITLPPWFHTKHKTKMRNLKINSQILTSHFDAYQTLRHMLSLDNYTKSRDIGESLFTNIAPLNRTCADAGVPKHFCPCTEFIPVRTNSSLVLKISREVVKAINKMLRANPLSKKLCDRLKLKQILRAQIKAPNDRMAKFRNTYEIEKCDRCGVDFDENFSLNVTMYEVVFSVEPSNGLFETTVEYLQDTKTIKVGGNDEISRLNVYGDQPKCIAMKIPGLRKYCFCKQTGNRIEKLKLRP